MNRLEKALYTLYRREGASTEEGGIFSMHPLIPGGVTLLFIGLVLSVPLHHPRQLLGFILYPWVTAYCCNERYLSLFLQSLTILPVLLCIALPNLFYPKGGLLACSLILRGLLCLQALLLLLRTTGFYPLCRSLSQGKLAGTLATQCLLVYRYIALLLKEVQRMQRAYKARSYGKAKISVKQWGSLTGHLLLRSIGRAERIHLAMKARGFRKSFPAPPLQSPHRNEWFYLGGWTLIFLLLRFL